MSTEVLEEDSNNLVTEPNITTRGPPKQSKMASLTPAHTEGCREGGSLLIDSILSQNEEEDIRRMLEIEGDIMGDVLPFTSTQMGSIFRRRPSLYLSPIMSREFQNPTCGSRDKSDGPRELGFSLPLNNRFEPMTNMEELLNDANLTRSKGTCNTEGQNKETEGDVTISSTLTAARALHGQGTFHDADRGVLTEHWALDAPDNDRAGDAESGEDSDAGLSKGVKGEEGEQPKGEERGDVDPVRVGERFVKVDKILGELGNRSKELTITVVELRTSLEFSQREIDALKAENEELRTKLNDHALEGERSNYQLNKLEEKVDRVDTLGRRKSLVLEGLPEDINGKEDVGKTIWGLFDQLNINKGVELEACYRQGPPSRHRPRPIIIAFLRQGDRDMVYANRMNLRKKRDYKQVWINEDLGPASKKTRNMIRLIARQAQTEGIDCRTGKYAIHVNKEKYDASSLDELPPPLHPSNVKQVMIDKDTIAYQSEYAPFSNMYLVCVTIGKYKFVSLEQAYQYL